MIEEIGGKKNARKSLANSPGWKLPRPGMRTQIRAPLISVPITGSMGESNSIRPTTIDT